MKTEKVNLAPTTAVQTARTLEALKARVKTYNIVLAETLLGIPCPGNNPYYYAVSTWILSTLSRNLVQLSGSDPEFLDDYAPENSLSGFLNGNSDTYAELFQREAKSRKVELLDAALPGRHSRTLSKWTKVAHGLILDEVSRIDDFTEFDPAERALYYLNALMVVRDNLTSDKWVTFVDSMSGTRAVTPLPARFADTLTKLSATFEMELRKLQSEVSPGQFEFTTDATRVVSELTKRLNALRIELALPALKRSKGDDNDNDNDNDNDGIEITATADGVDA